MQGKGFLTGRPTRVKYGSEKPTELPNLLFAGTEDRIEGAPQEQTQPNGVVTETPAPQTKVATENDSEKSGGKPKRLTKHRREDSDDLTSLRNTKVYQLSMRVDKNSKDDLDSLLNGIDAHTMRHARRAIIKKFKAYVLRSDLRRRKYNPQDPVIIRIEFTLTDADVDRIKSVEQVNEYEPIRTVIGRYTAPLFAEFLAGIKSGRT